MAAPTAKKIYYKIGEVCSLTDTQPYVLRFWESEFPQLAPTKTRSGQRIYRRQDVEMVREIKKLLYEEGYTIAGARKKLGSDDGAAPEPVRTSTPSESPDRLALLEVETDLRSSLAEILEIMDATDRRFRNT